MSRRPIQVSHQIGCHDGKHDARDEGRGAVGVSLRRFGRRSGEAHIILPSPLLLFIHPPRRTLCSVWCMYCMSTFSFQLISIYFVVCIEKKRKECPMVNNNRVRGRIMHRGDKRMTFCRSSCLSFCAGATRGRRRLRARAFPEGRQRRRRENGRHASMSTTTRKCCASSKANIVESILDASPETTTATMERSSGTSGGWSRRTSDMSLMITTSNPDLQSPPPPPPLAPGLVLFLQS